MKSPEIINIPSEEDAIAQIENENVFMSKRNKEWSQQVRDDFIHDLVGLGLISSLLTVILLCIVKYVWLASLLGTIVFVSYAFPVFLAKPSGQLYNFEMVNYSTSSQFYIATKGKHIVKSRISDGTLHLVLDDNLTSERSEAEIKNFRIERKKEIFNPTVDIENETIYLPLIRT